MNALGTVPAQLIGVLLDLARTGIIVNKHHRWVLQGSEEAKRWKRASLSLELHLACKMNPQASLKPDQWKADWKQHKVKSEEVKAEVSRQAEEPGQALESPWMCRG